MQGLLALTCFCWLLANVGFIEPTLMEASGQSYTYQVESSILSGIPESADQYSGLSLEYRLKLDVVGPNKAVFKIQDVRVGKLNEEVPVSYAEDIEFQHSPSPIYERELSKPIIVHYDGYLVRDFVAQKSDPTWSVNIKRALIEKFQIDLQKQGLPSSSSHSNSVPSIDPSASMYSVYEDGIGGECETRYHIQSIPSLDHPDMAENVLNVTKTKNYRNCKSRPVFDDDNIDWQGAPSVCQPQHAPISRKVPQIWRESSSAYESGCPFGFEPDNHPVRSYSMVSYNISGSEQSPTIESIIADGKTTYNHFDHAIMITSRMNATLVKKTSLRSQLPTISNPVTYDSLEFQLPEEDYLDTNDSQVFALFGPVDVEDLVTMFISNLESVTADIIPTEPETSKQSGAKIVQLSKAITVLKRPELEKIFKDLEPDSVQKVPRKQDIMRKVFLDLLAIAGDDESALFIRDLIVTQRVKIWEAAELVEGLAHNIDEPSEEVIEAYIKLLDRPRVQQSRRLFPAVAVTLAKMIEDSCVEDEEPQQHQHLDKQKSLPRHPRSLRKISSEESSKEYKKHSSHQHQQSQDEDECTQEELQAYIKLLAQKLHDSKSINKMYVYVLALTRIATPEILPYLKPYITGEAPNAQALEDEDTDFLRTTVIYTLKHFARDYPDKVLPLMANIYFDQSEDYEIRIAAFTVLMKTQPPLSLLERIMTELHQENNNQVGSFVYSLLSDLSNSTLPYERKMAQKIQLVIAHAPDYDSGIQYSNTLRYTTYDDDDDWGLNAAIGYVASNVSGIPRAFYSSMRFISAPYRYRVAKLSGQIKGADELLDKLLEPSGIATQILSALGSNVQVRNIPELLDIVKSRLLFKEADTDIFRAFLNFKLFGRTTYLTLDEQYVIEIIEQAIEWVRSVDSTSGYTGDYVKVWMPFSFFRAVPSTLGLPVVVTHRHPIILTLSLGNTRFSANQKKQAPLTSTFGVSTDIDASLHVASHAFAYVIDPANDELRGVAVEKTHVVAMATEIEVVVDLQKATYALSVRPKLPHEIFYHNTRPSTFVTPAVVISAPKEDWLEQVNEIESIPEPFKYDERHEARVLGMSVRVTGDSEDPWTDIPTYLSARAEDDDIIAAYLELAINPEIVNREIHVYLEPHRLNPVSEFLFTVDYESHLKLGLPKEQQQSRESTSSSSEEEEYEKAVTSIYGRSYSVPDAESTIEKLVQKTQATWAPVLGHGYSDPVPATVSHVLDATMAIKGGNTKHHAWRAVYAHSLDFRSNWFELIGHRSSDEHDRPWQFCSNLVAVFPEVPNPFYLEMNTLKAQSVKIQAEAGWGSDCQNENQIRIEGVMEKSEQQLTSSSGVYETEKDQQSLPWYFKQCQIDKTEGLTQSYACQQAISEDAELNVIKVEVKTDSLSQSIRNVTHKIDLWAKYYFYSNLQVNPFVSNPEDRVTFVLHYSKQAPNIPLIDLRVHKPTETLAFTKLYLPFYEPPSTLDSYDEVFMNQYYDYDYSPKCYTMEDFVTTFDNVTVSLPDNKCQYILAKDCSADKAYTIIVSQIDLQAKTKALSMSLAGHTVKALPPRGEDVPVVINGKEILVEPRKPVVLDFDKETELRIFVRPTSSSTDTPILVIEARDDGIIVLYDGKNVRLELPRSFQGDQCGLCGDFNDEQFQEFDGPNGCTYVEEEDFVHSYAIPGQSCTAPPMPEGPAFCPAEVTYQQKHQASLKSSKETSEESQERASSPRVTQPRHKQPQHPAPHFQGKSTRRPPSSSEEESREPKPLKPVKPQDSQESSEEDDKPSGPSRCIEAYTPIFESKSEQVTCFATEPAYKCKPGCRAVKVQSKQMPFHCLSQSANYEKILKEKATRGVVQQILNKKADKFRAVEQPEKCL